MYKVQKQCKACGKWYTPCFDCENDKTAFHWRTVACSPECGRKYFAMVEAARNKEKESDDFSAHMNAPVEEFVEDTNEKVSKISYKKKLKNNKESEQIGLEDGMY